MQVLAGIETGNLACEAPGGDDGNLMAEVHETFQDRGLSGHVSKGPGCVFRSGKPRLSFAIIAKAAGLQDRGRADFGKRRFKRGGITDI